MALDMKQFVTLDAEQIKEATEAAASKAEAYRAVREEITGAFEGNKRVGVETLAKFLDAKADEYAAASDPAYWQS